MFLNEQKQPNSLASNNYFRIVIGAGALGLFLSNIILEEYPNDNLFITSKSLEKKPIYIKKINNESNLTQLPHIILSSKLNTNYPKIIENNIIFYICLPPEAANSAFLYINLILQNIDENKKIYLIFLNNGFIDYQLFLTLQNEFRERKNLTLFLIRAIVLAGFMKIKNKNTISIINSSGKKIYYGYFQNSSLISMNFILPNAYFEWIYTEDIFNIEKAKFIVNFILGLCIGNNLISNENIYKILPNEKRNKIFENYCLLFPEQTLSIQYLENYFNDTIQNTSSNINSVSFALHHGDPKPIEYFIANIKNLAYLNNNKGVQLFFKELINLYYKNPSAT